MSKFYSTIITVLFIVVLASALPTSANAASLQGDPKPVCTLTSKWWEKAFGFCNDIKVEAPPVNTPSPYQPIDTTKWEKALADAELWLRLQAGDNNDPVDSSNPVKDLAWKYYCNSQEKAQYTVTGEPVCPSK